MRAMVQPPPSSKCKVCGGELRFKRVEQANGTLDLDCEIFVCAKCGREEAFTVSHTDAAPHHKVA